jgi:hypothetical protein
MANRWHQLGRWARPVQGDTSSIVGKPPKVARQQHDERGTFQP